MLNIAGFEILHNSPIHNLEMLANINCIYICPISLSFFFLHLSKQYIDILFARNTLDSIISLAYLQEDLELGLILFYSSVTAPLA